MTCKPDVHVSMSWVKLGDLLDDTLAYIYLYKKRKRKKYDNLYFLLSNWISFLIKQWMFMSKGENFELVNVMASLVS